MAKREVTVTFAGLETSENTVTLSFTSTETVIACRYFYYYYPNWPDETERIETVTPNRPVYDGTSWTVAISPYKAGNNYYKLRFITVTLENPEGTYVHYVGFPVYFNVYVTWEEQPPPKAINPTPANGANNVDKDVTSFYWQGVPSNIISKFYFQISGQWVYQGATDAGVTLWPVSSLSLQYATPYSWRIDTYDGVKELTTTGDTWVLTTETEPPAEPPTPPAEIESDRLVWGYNAGEGDYGWYESADIMTAGGGRYQVSLIAVGHNSIYYSTL